MLDWLISSEVRAKRISDGVVLQGKVLLAKPPLVRMSLTTLLDLQVGEALEGAILCEPEYLRFTAVVASQTEQSTDLWMTSTLLASMLTRDQRIPLADVSCTIKGASYQEEGT
ncbi:MAG: hypothetical protein MUC92_08565, partial [Fimbriimonadaceae bacterium]|nr:hypothetical protein [Fimbriimonadaceae bacterium]